MLAAVSVSVRPQLWWSLEMIITNKSWHHCTTSLRSAMLHTAANLLSSQKHDFPNCVNSLTGPAVVQLSGETRWNIPSSPQVTLIADTQADT